MNNQELIQQFERRFTKQCLKLLDDMFASCDDLFFDLASRSSSNIEQNLFFESMREIRLKTALTRNNYEQSFAALFESVHKNTFSNTEHAIGDKSIEQLDLVDDNTSEKMVALTNMATRAASMARSILPEFMGRLVTLYNNDAIDLDNNPVSPLRIAELFASASEEIDLEIKPRIILFKQYERFIMNRLVEIYADANQLLAEHKIKIHGLKNKNTRQQAPKAQHNNEAPFPDDAYLDDANDMGYRYSAPSFNDLSHLLSSIRSTPNSPLAQQIPWFQSGQYGSKISQGELFNLIAQFQQNTDAQTAGTEGIRHFISSALSANLPEGQMRAVEQADEDIINLVAMFFDFILDDHDIPLKVQSLISRLQIPILKLALKDKRFFSQSNHPARTLINEIARLSIGIVDDDESSQFLEKVEKIIQIIHDAESPNAAIFEKILVDLETFSKREEKRADLVTKRTSEAAKGKAQTNIARIKAQQAIREAMNNKDLPFQVSSFVSKYWQEALFTGMLKGETSPEWLERLQNLQDLLWCTLPHNDQKSSQRREKILADLYTKLSLGLKDTAVPPKISDNEIKKLKAIHNQLFPSEQGNAEQADSEAVDIDIQTYDAEKDDSLDTIHANKNWSEMTALERQKVEYKALTYDYIKKAEAMKIGQWLEFKEARSGSTIRCKLAAKLENSDTFVFVNRLGFKVVEKPRKEFAYELQHKRARVLDQSSLFDRSIHKMVQNLKKMSHA